MIKRLIEIHQGIAALERRWEEVVEDIYYLNYLGSGWEDQPAPPEYTLAPPDKLLGGLFYIEETGYGQVLRSGLPGLGLTIHVFLDGDRTSIKIRARVTRVTGKGRKRKVEQDDLHTTTGRLCFSRKGRGLRAYRDGKPFKVGRWDKELQGLIASQLRPRPAKQVARYLEGVLREHVPAPYQVAGSTPRSAAPAPPPMEVLYDDPFQDE